MLLFPLTVMIKKTETILMMKKQSKEGDDGKEN